MTANDLSITIKHFRRMYHKSIISDNGQLSEFEDLEILTSLHDLDELHKRMTESNRSDFIGWEI